MGYAKRVKPGLHVLGSDKSECAVVDHMEGATMIRVKKDSHGTYHFIPLAWVKSVDDKVHLDRPVRQVTAEWRTSL